MIRRLLIPLLGSGLLLAATAGSALAKCEGENPPAFCSQVVASIDLGSGGATIRAGTATPIRVWINRGEAPLEAISVALVLARVADGTVVDVTAEQVYAGLWRTTVNLPAGGSWTVVAEVVDVNGNLTRLNLDTLQVSAALRAPQPPVTTPPATPINPAPPAWPIALLVAGLAAGAVGAVVVRQRSRSRAPAG